MKIKILKIYKMNNETDNTDLESTESTSTLMPVRQKNPKRVEAGKKGAAARKAKREAAKSETESAKTEIEPSEITKDEPEIKQHVNLPKNYKNYFIPIVALAAGFYFIRMQPKKEEKQINHTAKTAVKKVYDPFDD